MRIGDENAAIRGGVESVLGDRCVHKSGNRPGIRAGDSEDSVTVAANFQNWNVTLMSFFRHHPVTEKAQRGSFR
jgi:hypothetical protein